jgi:hypothetical protein
MAVRERSSTVSGGIARHHFGIRGDANFSTSSSTPAQITAESKSNTAAASLNSRAVEHP